MTESKWPVRCLEITVKFYREKDYTVNCTTMSEEMLLHSLIPGEDLAVAVFRSAFRTIWDNRDKEIGHDILGVDSEVG